jgi:hypothetical protein
MTRLKELQVQYFTKKKKKKKNKQTNDHDRHILDPWFV